MSGPSLLFRRGPKPDATTGALASSTAASLISAGLTRWHGDQSLHSGSRVKLGVTRQSAIDHEAHTIQGEGTFSDGRCQDHASCLCAVARLQGSPLLSQ